MKEIWRTIAGTNGWYKISNLGRVKSFASGQPYIRKIQVGVRGYPVVTLTIKNEFGETKLKNKTVHMIIAQAFLGPKPSPEMQVCHLDGNPLNSRLDNLKWATPVENNSHKILHGTLLHGERSPSAKITKETAIEIMDSKERGVDLAKKFGISEQHVCGIRRGRHWTHIRGDRPKPPAMKLGRPKKTHCKNGHPLSGNNLLQPHGNPRCRICKNYTSTVRSRAIAERAAGRIV